MERDEKETCPKNRKNKHRRPRHESDQPPTTLDIPSSKSGSGGILAKKHDPACGQSTEISPPDVGKPYLPAEALDIVDGIRQSSSKTKTLALLPSIEESALEDNIANEAKAPDSPTSSSSSSSPVSLAWHAAVPRVSSRPTLTSISEELIVKTSEHPRSQLYLDDDDLEKSHSEHGAASTKSRQKKGKSHGSKLVANQSYRDAVVFGTGVPDLPTRSPETHPGAAAEPDDSFAFPKYTHSAGGEGAVVWCDYRYKDPSFLISSSDNLSSLASGPGDVTGYGNQPFASHEDLLDLADHGIVIETHEIAAPEAAQGDGGMKPCIIRHDNIVLGPDTTEEYSSSSAFVDSLPYVSDSFLSRNHTLNNDDPSRSNDGRMPDELSRSEGATFEDSSERDLLSHFSSAHNPSCLSEDAQFASRSSSQEFVVPSELSGVFQVRSITGNDEMFCFLGEEQVLPMGDIWGSVLSAVTTETTVFKPAAYFASLNIYINQIVLGSLCEVIVQLAIKKATQQYEKMEKRKCADGIPEGRDSDEDVKHGIGSSRPKGSGSDSIIPDTHTTVSSADVSAPRESHSEHNAGTAGSDKQDFKDKEANKQRDKDAVSKQRGRERERNKRKRDREDRGSSAGKKSLRNAVGDVRRSEAGPGAGQPSDTQGRERKPPRRLECPTVIIVDEGVLSVGNSRRGEEVGRTSRSDDSGDVPGNSVKSTCGLESQTVTSLTGDSSMEGSHPPRGRVRQSNSYETSNEEEKACDSGQGESFKTSTSRFGKRTSLHRQKQMNASNAANSLKATSARNDDEAEDCHGQPSGDYRRQECGVSDSSETADHKPVFVPGTTSSPVTASNDLYTSSSQDSFHEGSSQASTMHFSSTASYGALRYCSVYDESFNHPPKYPLERAPGDWAQTSASLDGAFRGDQALRNDEGLMNIQASHDSQAEEARENITLPYDLSSKQGSTNIRNENDKELGIVTECGSSLGDLAIHQEPDNMQDENRVEVSATKEQVGTLECGVLVEDRSEVANYLDLDVNLKHPRTDAEENIEADGTICRDSAVREDFARSEDGDEEIITAGDQVAIDRDVAMSADLNLKKAEHEQAEEADDDGLEANTVVKNSGLSGDEHIEPEEACSESLDASVEGSEGTSNMDNLVKGQNEIVKDGVLKQEVDPKIASTDGDEYIRVEQINTGSDDDSKCSDIDVDENIETENAINDTAPDVDTDVDKPSKENIKMIETDLGSMSLKVQELADDSSEITREKYGGGNAQDVTFDTDFEKSKIDDHENIKVKEIKADTGKDIESDKLKTSDVQVEFSNLLMQNVNLDLEAEKLNVGGDENTQEGERTQVTHNVGLDIGRLQGTGDETTQINDGIDLASDERLDANVFVTQSKVDNDEMIVVTSVCDLNEDFKESQLSDDFNVQVEKTVSGSDVDGEVKELNVDDDSNNIQEDGVHMESLEENVELLNGGDEDRIKEEDTRITTPGAKFGKTEAGGEVDSRAEELVNTDSSVNQIIDVDEIKEENNRTITPQEQDYGCASIRVGEKEGKDENILVDEEDRKVITAGNITVEGREISNENTSWKDKQISDESITVDEAVEGNENIPVVAKEGGDDSTPQEDKQDCYENILMDEKQGSHENIPLEGMTEDNKNTIVEITEGSDDSIPCKEMRDDDKNISVEETKNGNENILMEEKEGSDKNISVEGRSEDNENIPVEVMEGGDDNVPQEEKKDDYETILMAKKDGRDENTPLKETSGDNENIAVEIEEASDDNILCEEKKEGYENSLVGEKEGIDENIPVVESIEDNKKFPVKVMESDDDNTPWEEVKDRNEIISVEEANSGNENIITEEKNGGDENTHVKEERNENIPVEVAEEDNDGILRKEEEYSDENIHVQQEEVCARPIFAEEEEDDDTNIPVGEEAVSKENIQTERKKNGNESIPKVEEICREGERESDDRNIPVQEKESRVENILAGEISERGEDCGYTPMDENLVCTEENLWEERDDKVIPVKEREVNAKYIPTEEEKDSDDDKIISAEEHLANVEEKAVDEKEGGFEDFPVKKENDNDEYILLEKEKNEDKDISSEENIAIDENVILVEREMGDKILPVREKVDGIEELAVEERKSSDKNYIPVEDEEGGKEIIPVVKWEDDDKNIPVEENSASDGEMAVNVKEGSDNDIIVQKEKGGDENVLPEEEKSEDKDIPMIESEEYDKNIPMEENLAGVVEMAVDKKEGSDDDLPVEKEKDSDENILLEEERSEDKDTPKAEDVAVDENVIIVEREMGDNNLPVGEKMDDVEELTVDEHKRSDKYIPVQKEEAVEDSIPVVEWEEDVQHIPVEEKIAGTEEVALDEKEESDKNIPVGEENVVDQNIHVKEVKANDENIPEEEKIAVDGNILVFETEMADENLSIKGKVTIAEEMVVEGKEGSEENITAGEKTEGDHIIPGEVKRSFYATIPLEEKARSEEINPVKIEVGGDKTIPEREMESSNENIPVGENGDDDDNVLSEWKDDDGGSIPVEENVSSDKHTPKTEMLQGQENVPVEGRKDDGENIPMKEKAEKKEIIPVDGMSDGDNIITVESTGDSENIQTEDKAESERIIAMEEETSNDNIILVDTFGDKSIEVEDTKKIHLDNAPEEHEADIERSGDADSRQSKDQTEYFKAMDTGVEGDTVKEVGSKSTAASNMDMNIDKEMPKIEDDEVFKPMLPEDYFSPHEPETVVSKCDHMIMESAELVNPQDADSQADHFSKASICSRGAFAFKAVETMHIAGENLPYDNDTPINSAEGDAIAPHEAYVPMQEVQNSQVITAANKDVSGSETGLDAADDLKLLSAESETKEVVDPMANYDVSLASYETGKGQSDAEVLTSPVKTIQKTRTDVSSVVLNETVNDSSKTNFIRQGFGSDDDVPWTSYFGINTGLIPDGEILEDYLRNPENPPDVSITGEANKPPNMNIMTADEQDQLLQNAMSNPESVESSNTSEQWSIDKTPEIDETPEIDTAPDLDHPAVTEAERLAHAVNEVDSYRPALLMKTDTSIQQGYLSQDVQISSPDHLADTARVNEETKADREEEAEKQQTRATLNQSGWGEFVVEVCVHSGKPSESLELDLGSKDEIPVIEISEPLHGMTSAMMEAAVDNVEQHIRPQESPVSELRVSEIYDVHAEGLYSEDKFENDPHTEGSLDHHVEAIFCTHVSPQLTPHLQRMHTPIIGDGNFEGKDDEDADSENLGDKLKVVLGKREEEEDHQDLSTSEDAYITKVASPVPRETKDGKRRVKRGEAPRHMQHVQGTTEEPLLGRRENTLSEEIPDVDVRKLLKAEDIEEIIRNNDQFIHLRPSRSSSSPPSEIKKIRVVDVGEFPKGRDPAPSASATNISQTPAKAESPRRPFEIRHEKKSTLWRRFKAILRPPKLVRRDGKFTFVKKYKHGFVSHSAILAESPPYVPYTLSHNRLDKSQVGHMQGESRGTLQKELRHADFGKELIQEPVAPDHVITAWHRCQSPSKGMKLRNKHMVKRNQWRRFRRLRVLRHSAEKMGGTIPAVKRHNVSGKSYLRMSDAKIKDPTEEICPLAAKAQEMMARPRPRKKHDFPLLEHPRDAAASERCEVVNSATPEVFEVFCNEDEGKEIPVEKTEPTVRLLMKPPIVKASSGSDHDIGSGVTGRNSLQRGQNQEIVSAQALRPAPRRWPCSIM